MEVIVALDTNRYTDLSHGDEAVANALQDADALVMTFVTIAELRGGFAHGTRGKANERLLRQFLRRDDVKSLYPDDGTTVHYAQLYRELRSAGTPVPTNDIWIAALVLQHNLLLYTRDDHFRHLPQVPLL